MPQSPNRILNALPQNIFAAMEPHLRNVTLAFGDVIAETGELRPVGIHREFITAAVRWIMAAKL
jgi:hypothetical protein